MPTTTNFPIRPSKFTDPTSMAWTIWQNLLYLANSIFDPFFNKFQGGSAVITNPATTTTVAHTLGTSAFNVSVVPLGDPGSRYWVSGKTASQFVINLQTTPAGSVTFDWYAKAA